MKIPASKVPAQVWASRAAEHLNGGSRDSGKLRDGKSDR